MAHICLCICVALGLCHLATAFSHVNVLKYSNRYFLSNNLYKISIRKATFQSSIQNERNVTNVANLISPKTVTKDIVAFYNQYPRNANQDVKSKYVKTFSKYLQRPDVKVIS